MSAFFLDARRQPAPGGSLVQQAIQAVADHIRTEHMHAGDSLPSEQVFAERLGVSRAVMREAFGALAALQRIDVGNGRRARVAALDAAPIAATLDHAVSTAQVTVGEVWDVRRSLELRTAALAARHRTGGEAVRLVRLADAMSAQADDLEAVTRNDIAFHGLIAEMGRNALFTLIVSSFAPLMEIAVPAAWRTRTQESQRQAILQQHRLIAVAIADGDPAAATAAMEAHFDNSIGDILRSAGER